MLLRVDRGRASHAPEGRDDWPYKLDACHVKRGLAPSLSTLNTMSYKQ